MTKAQLAKQIEKINDKLFKMKLERNWMDNQIAQLEEERNTLVEAEKKIG